MEEDYVRPQLMEDINGGVGERRNLTDFQKYEIRRSARPQFSEDMCVTLIGRVPSIPNWAYYRWFNIERILD